MKKDFESRFMPNVKFLLPKQSDARTWFNLLEIIKVDSFDNYIGFCTNALGDIIYNGFEVIELFNNYKSVHKEVSIYEAIPELIPDGMRYNKELDKLVPDVINVEFVKVLNVSENGDVLEKEIEINLSEDEKNMLNSLRNSGKSFLEIIDIIKNTDTFTPSYYGAKCKCGEKLDAYAICDKYSNKHKTSAWHHAVKKLIRAGDGHKPLLKDIDEVIDSLKRWKEQLNAK